MRNFTARTVSTYLIFRNNFLVNGPEKTRSVFFEYVCFCVRRKIIRNVSSNGTKILRYFFINIK